MVQTQLRSGALIRLRRGVFLAQSAWPSDPRLRHQLLARAEVSANPDAVISHESAAVTWDYRSLDSDTGPTPRCR